MSRSLNASTRRRKTEAKTQVRTILVAIADPLAKELWVVDRAAQLAKALGARLILFHAAFDSSLSGSRLFASQRLAKARGLYVAERMQALERRAKALKRAGIATTVSVVWEDPPHEAIIRGAIREKADLVVAGAHEHRPDVRPFLRLTDWELMRLCPRPVLIVHPASSARDTGAVLAALDPTHAYDKPAHLDVSVFTWASTLAAALQTPCHAVHVVAPGAYPLGATQRERKRHDQQMESKLKQVVRRAHADVAAIHIEHGRVADALTEFATKLPAPMLAMGIISRRWLQRFVVGDTAESVIRNVPCDLLVVKPAEFRLQLGRTRKEAIVLPATERPRKSRAARQRA